MTPKFKSLAVTTSLAAASFLADLEAVLKISQNILWGSSNYQTAMNLRIGKPVIIVGIPQLDETEYEEQTLSIYRIGMMAYAYKIVTVFVVASDKESAIRKAEILKVNMDRLASRQYPKNGNIQWKMHTSGEAVSNEEVIELAKNAEVVVTLY
ncbi:hypothetical protein AAD018_015625 [Aestuariibius insulae]|uniref:hypothetical protein n=1 Tax=Aestuariibius insulae TaxID=2058287 RepID=UPI00345EDAE7